MIAERQVMQEEALQALLDQKTLLSVYQPLVSLVERKIFAREALSRGPLESPFYSPLRLFEAARKQGQLVRLESLSREKAITGFAEQQLPGKLFINISPDVLTQPDHEPGQTLEAIKALGLGPECLVIQLGDERPE